jgi:PAS domain S-box-containing protein
MRDKSGIETNSVAPGNAPVPSLALLRVAIEAVVDAVVVTSPDLDLPGPVIEYVNPAFTALTGYTADEVIGRSPRFLQGPRTERASLDRLRAELTTIGSASGESINYRKDGREYVVEWLITAVRDEQGRIQHWVAAQRDVTERHRMQARQAVLLAELQHRTRNQLAVVRAIAERTLDGSPALTEFDARLAALGRVQGLLSRHGQQWAVSLAEIVRAELDAHGAAMDDRVQIEGSAVELPGEQVQLVAMALHELATNALKYGALSLPSGRLLVAWYTESEQRGEQDSIRQQLVLSWRESGVPLSAGPPVHQGYGCELIEYALPYQLGAESCLEFTVDGVHCTIVMPIIPNSGR